MLRANELYNTAVFIPRNERGKLTTIDEASDTSPLQVGKVHMAVFAPGGKRLVGFLVKRRDVAMMFKRDDVFLALDSCEFFKDGIYATRAMDSFDDVARKRLQLDWDSSILWEGMDVKTENGRELGYANDILFDEHTGAVKTFFVGDGGTARSLVGSVEIPVELLRGYDQGFMIVDAEAGTLGLNGGFAAQAGEATARAGLAAHEMGKRIGHEASQALDKGSHALGKMIGQTKRVAQESIAQITSDGEKTEEIGTTTEDATTSNSSTHTSVKKTASNEKAARAIGRQLGKFGSMFSDFAKEYKKSSK